MGAYRYCRHCGNGMGRISLDDLLGSPESKVECRHCRNDRDDDTPEERAAVLANAIEEVRTTMLDLRTEIESLKDMVYDR